MAKLPPDCFNSWGDYLKKILPGLFFCILLGITAWRMEKIIQPHFFMINYVIIAILLGVAGKNLVLKRLKTTPVFQPGIDFCTRVFLMVGVVILGTRMDFREVTSVGGNALVMVGISITLGIILGGIIGSKTLGKRGGHLLGIGIGICGVSAIMASAPILKSREKEIIVALGAVILTDFLVLFGLPIVAAFWGWGEVFTGYFAGTVTANTAQAVAVGHAHSLAAGTVATITKSARNALMPAAILTLGYIYTKRGLPTGECISIKLLWERFPKFVLGFLLASVFSTLGVFSPGTLKAFSNLSQWLFVFCFVGLGAGIDFSLLGKRDLLPVFFGVGIAVIIGVYAFFWIRLVLGVN